MQTQDVSEKPRLLAVDDSEDSAELITRVAVRSGYDARRTSDPTSVRQLLLDWKPDVVTLDICMPEADGIVLLSILQDVGFTGKVVIISGQDDWFRKVAVKLADTRGIKIVQDFQKPIDINALRQLLSGILEAGTTRPALTS
ncbi:MAG TPA: response regulator [Candidatus Sulfotelmatobacter sp.]|nr:response regulator [Candidatus Sulfotelmatobacter sp.]